MQEIAIFSVLSLLELRIGDKLTYLNVQYRMAPEIAGWPAGFFYRGKFQNPESRQH